MGPAQTRSTCDTEQNVNVPELQLQLEAYVSLSSSLNARLMSAIDTLDEMRLLHAAQLDEERTAREALHSRLRGYENALRDAEEERDTMRDAVLKLVEKVELNNDYGLWPHSDMLVPSLAVPARVRRPLPQDSDSDPSLAFRAYAKSIISSLRNDFEHEKAAHENTVHRVAVLEAQVARREAELANATLNPRGKQLPVPMTREKAIKIVEHSAARNMNLTRNVEGLIERLEEARAASPQPEKHRMPPTLGRKFQPAPRRQPSPEIASAAQKDASNTQPPPGAPGVFRSLDRQIDAVTAPTTAFDIEKRYIQHALAPANQNEGISGEGPTREFPDILLIEAECIRLRASVQRTLAESAAFKAAAHAREQALLGELAQLRGAPSAPGVHDAPTIEMRDIFDEIDDEQPMDLATPLLPTALLIPSSPPLPVSASPSLASLPVSPVANLRDAAFDTVELERVRASLQRAQEQLAAKDAELGRLRTELVELLPLPLSPATSE